MGNVQTWQRSTAKNEIGQKVKRSLEIICVFCFCSQVIENLDTLSSLQSLFLGTNKITKLQNLDGLHNLTVLSIQVLSYK